MSRLVAGIDQFDLPKTFLDAVKFSRYLGIRYLWIDSLCIIQDDDEDWNREAALMVQIFQNSTITIAATASDGADSGLFRTSIDVTDTQPSSLIGNSDFEGVFLTYPSDYLDSQYHGLGPRPGNDIPELLTRSWVLQERLLSARVLHFNNELVFECLENCYCECQHGSSILLTESLATKEECDESVLATLRFDRLYVSWRFILREYTRTQLSFDSDVLPALSGIANVFLRYMGGQYIAGLWERMLIPELTWMIITPRSSTRRTPWTAPTFSWASMRMKKPSDDEMREFDTGEKHGGFVEWGLRWAYKGLTNSSVHPGFEVCHIIGFQSDLVGNDPTGKIAYAHIVLKGTLYPTIVQGLNKLSSPCEPALRNDEEQHFFADFDYTHPREAERGISEGTQLYLFVLQAYKAERGNRFPYTVSDPFDHTVSIVLQRVGDSPGMEGVYERIGIVEYKRRSYSNVASRLEEIRGRSEDAVGVVPHAVVKII